MRLFFPRVLCKIKQCRVARRYWDVIVLNDPADATCWPIAVLMLVQRLRRWPNINNLFVNKDRFYLANKLWKPENFEFLLQTVICPVLYIVGLYFI